MNLHLPSVAVGVAAVSVIFVSMSQAIPGGANPPRIEYGPHPRDMVQIAEGTPYTVPPGQIFVLTALGTTMGQGNCILQLNGQTTDLIALPVSGSSETTMRPVPLGFTVHGGSTIALLSQTSGQTLTGRAWGYLSK